MIENAKENSQRVELKDRIIETASEALLHMVSRV